MFGSYPFDERWRVVLTGILFVALLVPLMIPKVPYKGLNAILFFGVFPVVALHAAVGAALPFGLVGLVALIVNIVIWMIGALSADRAHPGVSLLSGIGKIGLVVGLPRCVRRVLRLGRIAIRQRQLLCRPAVRRVSDNVANFVPAPRTGWAARSQSLWMDLGSVGARGARPDAVAAQFANAAIVTTLVAMIAAGRGHQADRAGCRPAAGRDARCGADCW